MRRRAACASRSRWRRPSPRRRFSSWRVRASPSSMPAHRRPRWRRCRLASSTRSAITKTMNAEIGELAALPAADLAARLGRGALAWQAVARGDDTRPLVPALPEERFDATLELEWPIEALESLSFVLT